MDRLKSLSSTSNVKDINSLIGSIHKINLEDPQLSSRCRKNKRVSKQNTMVSDSSRQKINAIYNSNNSQDLEYNKTSGVLKKNKSNCSQKFEKITASDKQLKKDSSGYSRTNNTNKKYYSTINNSNSERGNKISTQKLRKDIEELKSKHSMGVNKAKNNTNVASNYRPERSSKKSAYPDAPARVQAKFMLSTEKSGTQAKIVKLNSNKSIGENDSEHSTIAQSTSYTSGYFKKAIKSNKKLEDLAQKYGDYYRNPKKATKVESLIQNYNRLKVNNNDLSKGN